LTALALYEDLLDPGEVLALPAGSRILYVASGDAAGLRPNEAWGGDGEVEVAAGEGGATVLRFELTDWEPDAARLATRLDVDPWEEYVLRCERVSGRALPEASGPGIGCLLRGEVVAGAETVEPFGAWAEPADLVVATEAVVVRVLLVRRDQVDEDALAHATVAL
jgi:hypothetical protein